MQIIKKLPWPEIIVVAAVIAAGASIYAYAHRDEASLEESKRRGAAIVSALHEYHASHGDYPDRLEDLVPQNIERIEPPTWGLGRWHYRRYTAADVAPGSARDGAVWFQLAVAARESGYPVLYYDLIAARWVLNN